MPLIDKQNIAVFVDYDNIEIGLKTTLRREFDVSLCLDALKERGDIVAKFAYANWGRQEGAARQMAENAVQMVQRLPSPRGDKNGGDINLALDALEMAFTHTHVNAFAIISGDSDFIPLVNKLKEYGKTVYVVGGKAFTSNILQSNCHEFVAYENLLMDRAARLDGTEGGPQLEKLKQELGEALNAAGTGIAASVTVTVVIAETAVIAWTETGSKPNPSNPPNALCCLVRNSAGVEWLPPRRRPKRPSAQAAKAAGNAVTAVGASVVIVANVANGLIGIAIARNGSHVQSAHRSLTNRVWFWKSMPLCRWLSVLCRHSKGVACRLNSACSRAQ